MKLKDIKANQLNIKIRDGRVRVTFGNKGVDIYQGEQTEHGVELVPVFPWSGRRVVAKSWADAKRQVETQVFAAFGGATKDAQIIANKLGVTIR